AAWEACRVDVCLPAAAMREYVEWVEALPGRPVFVAYPAGYDFTFVYWYLLRFAGRSPFSHAALDVKSYAMAVMKSRFRDSTKRHMPRRWFPAVTHSHVALDDAREQGLLFMAMLRERLAEP
ncbi:MAG TPA: exonuclease, partial [Myxococcota bacterium]